MRSFKAVITRRLCTLWWNVSLQNLDHPIYTLVRGHTHAITRTYILSITLATFLSLVVFPREPIRTVGLQATSSSLQFMKRISRTRYLV